MPQLDQTGPSGQGPKTGRGRGPCNNDNTQPSDFCKRGRGIFKNQHAGRRRSGSNFS